MFDIKRGLFVAIMMIPWMLSAQERWSNYDFDAFNFRIQLPKEPTLSIDTSNLDDSSVYTYLWEYSSEDEDHPNAYYSISRATYPSDFIHSDSLFEVVEGFLNSTQTSLFENDELTYLSSSLIEKNGYPGKVFKWKNHNSDVNFEFHEFLVENHLIQLSIVSRSGCSHNTSINRFVDSFELIQVPNGTFKIPDLSFDRKLMIRFPGKYTETTRVVDSEYGHLMLAIRMMEPDVEDRNRLYIASETMYPRSVVDVSDSYRLNAFYMESIHHSMESVNGDLISVQNVYYKEHLGKEYRCYFSEGKAILIHRIFFIDDCMYMFGVATAAENENNEAMMTFLKSFDVRVN
ncbi:MAG: hypothetical protein AB7D40_10725 [Bacteroidales bacterium]